MDPLDLTLLLVGEDPLGDELFEVLEARGADIERAAPGEALEVIRVAAPDLVILAPNAVTSHADRIRDGLLAEHGARPPRLLVLCAKATAARVGAYRHTWIGTLEPEAGCEGLANTIERLLPLLVEDPDQHKAFRTMLSNLQRVKRTVQGLAPPPGVAAAISAPAPPPATVTVSSRVPEPAPPISAAALLSAPPGATSRRPATGAIAAPPPVGLPSSPAAVPTPPAPARPAPSLRSAPKPTVAPTPSLRSAPTSPAAPKTAPSLRSAPKAPAAVKAKPSLRSAPKPAATPAPSLPSDEEEITVAVSEPPLAAAREVTPQGVPSPFGQPALSPFSQGAPSPFSQPAPSSVEPSPSESEPPQLLFRVPETDSKANDSSAEQPPVLCADDLLDEPPTVAEPQLFAAEARGAVDDEHSTLKALSDLRIERASIRDALAPWLARAVALWARVRALAAGSSARLATASPRVRALASRMRAQALAAPPRVRQAALVGGVLAVATVGLVASSSGHSTLSPLYVTGSLKAALSAPKAAAAEAPEPAPAPTAPEAPEEGAAPPAQEPQVHAELGDPEPMAPGPSATRATRRGRSIAAANQHIRVGHRLRKQRRLGMAEASYLKALKELPGYPRAMAGLVRVHLNRRDGREALRWAQRLVRRQPKRGNNQLLLGDAYKLSGNTTKARQAWRQALRYGNVAARKRLRR